MALHSKLYGKPNIVKEVTLQKKTKQKQTNKQTKTNKQTNKQNKYKQTNKQTNKQQQQQQQQQQPRVFVMYISNYFPCILMPFKIQILLLNRLAVQANITENGYISYSLKCNV